MAPTATGARLFLRRTHFYFAAFCSGLSLMLLLLQLPDIATQAYEATPDACKADPKGTVCTKARQQASNMLGLSNGGKAVLTLVLGPMLGSISDVHGRRFFWIGTLVAAQLGYLVIFLHTLGFMDLGPFLIFNTINGLLLPALLAVVSDEYQREQRAMAYGLLIATFEVSILIGPLMGKWLTIERGMGLVNVSGFVSILAACCFGETLPRSHRLSREETALVQIWRPDIALRILISNTLFRRLSVIVFFSTLPMAGSQQCFLMFLEAAFGFDRVKCSGFIVVLAVCGLVIQMLVLPTLIPAVGVSKTLLIGLVLQLVQNLLLTFVHTPTSVLVSCIFGGFGTMIFPCVAALKSAAAGEQEQGRVQGAVSALQSSTMGVGPVVYGAVFAWTLGDGVPGGHPRPSATFMLSVVALVIAIAFASTIEKYVPEECKHTRPPSVRRSVSLLRRLSRTLSGTSLQEGSSPGPACTDSECGSPVAADLSGSGVTTGGASAVDCGRACSD